MADLVVNEDGFALLPPTTEPPEGIDELAQQEMRAATSAAPVAAPAPPVVGRTYRLDQDAGRFTPVGGPPAGIRGVDAMRQAVEKALRTSRGSATVQGDDYGREDADRDVEGQPFDAAAFADLEDRTRDALLALPWVLAVDTFDVAEEPGDTATAALVTFRVVPEGDAEPLTFDPFPVRLS